MPHPLTLWTARAVVACCVVAWLLAIRGDRGSGRGPLIWRAVWTAGCISLAVHVLTAMHFEHGWSHAAAFRHTARQTRDIVGIDWGGGLYFNYALVMLWTVDVTLLWARPKATRRLVWFHRLNEWFCAFMILNATVVFGPSWWIGVGVAFGVICLVAIRREEPST